MPHEDPTPDIPAVPADPFADAGPGQADLAGDTAPSMAPSAGSDAPAPAASSGGGRSGVIGALVAAVAVLTVVVAILLGQSFSGGGSAAPAVVAAPGAASAPAQPTTRPTAAATATPAAPPTPSVASTGPVPAGAVGFGGPMVLNPGAPAGVPTLDIFEDPQCPICKQFEAIFGTAITDLVKNNDAKVIVHTMTFLDRNLRNDSSVRAANAAFCAADQGKFQAYMSAVYAGQPAKEGDGWTDARLTEFASAVGISGAGLQTWSACHTSSTYVAHIAALEVNSERLGVNGTPTAVLNGKQLNLSGLDADGFRAAVKAGGR